MYIVLQNQVYSSTLTQPTGDYKFDASGANTALKLLGQTIGMFKEESRIKIVADRPLMTITVPKRPKKEVE